MSNNKKISLLIPAYNESQSLPALRKALIGLMNGPLSANYDFEVLFVNDGSADDTLDILRSMHDEDDRFSYVSLSRNFGKENAMLAGFDYLTGDCAVILDADLQDPVDVIPTMVEWWEQGYEDVYGRRSTRGKESWLRKKLSLTFYDILQRSTRFDILPNVGDFRLLDRRCINALRELREGQRYTKGLFCWIGYRKKEVVFERHDREGGKSSFNFKSLFNLAIEGITSFTTTPLRIASVLGFLVSFIAVIYICIIVAKTIFFGEVVKGFPTLMCIILFLGGVQLLCIGIIGEYVGRIFLETKHRPVYLADEYNRKKV